ncbi:MAG: aldehyde dehydrogenase family protein [Candidatus Methylomirabilales bacterium]
MSHETHTAITAKTYANHVGDEWIPAASGATYTTVNPADFERVNGVFPRSGPEDIRRAVEAARQAMDGWRRVPAPRRAEVLYRVWHLLRERGEEIAATISLETGKVLTDARGEVKRACNVLEFAAGDGRRLKGETIPSELPKNFIYTLRKPLGLVGVITPWNFPLAIPLWKLAPALVCGNAVIFKPATTTPLCAVRIVELFREAGLPPGVLNLVIGQGSTVGQALVEHPEVRAISFTGSTEVGRNLNVAAAGTLKRIQCEMGGKNAVVILEDADLDLAVEAIVQGAFGFCGQRCTATSRVILDRHVERSLVEALTERVAHLPVRPPFDPEAAMGPLASESQLTKVQEYLQTGQQEGARLMVGGERMKGPEYDRGYYLTPALFTEVQPHMRIAQEEIFGPVLSVLSCDGLADAVKLVDAVSYGFKASIYTRDFQRIMDFIDEVDVGMVHINAPTLGGEVQAPFGGIKASGVGIKEQGRAQIEFFTEEIVVFMDHTGTKRDAKFI